MAIDQNGVVTRKETPEDDQGPTSTKTVAAPDDSILSSYGVKSEQVTFPRVTASSHRWICCRHTSKKKKRDNCVTAINLTRRTPRALTWPCSADSAMMNPRKPWLALKAGKHFQIFNIVAEKQLYRCTMKDEVQYWSWLNDDVIGIVGSKFIYHWDLSPLAGKHFQIFNIVAEKQLYRCTMKDEVQYWSWLNDDVIGIVGSKFIYHWDLSPLGFSCPMKAFPRHGRLNFCQIVGYKADPSFRWFAVLGLYRDYEDVVSSCVFIKRNPDLTPNLTPSICVFSTLQDGDSNSVSGVV
eukprot:XP_011664814.1 PREDICTED: clathrin heavy chain 1 [Strongylocentrotus purpuratus]